MEGSRIDLHRPEVLEQVARFRMLLVTPTPGFTTYVGVLERGSDSDAISAHTTTRYHGKTPSPTVVSVRKKRLPDPLARGDGRKLSFWGLWPQSEMTSLERGWAERNTRPRPEVIKLNVGYRD
jgi:hypothetical protein